MGVRLPDGGLCFTAGMGVVTSAVRVFRESRVELVESPYWDGGALYFVDIPTGTLHVCPGDGAVDGSDDLLLAFPPPLASIHPRRDRTGFVAALADRVVLADDRGTIERELGRVQHPEPHMRLNEGKVDPQGRFVVGSLSTDQHPVAGWYRTGPDGLELLFDGITTSNGLDWSADQRTVYLTDTPTHTVFTADWDAERGPGPRRPLHVDGRPDGLAIDVEGCLWSAHYGDGVVVRLRPDGEEIERVELPCPNVAGVCFGGDDRSTLFVGGARENMSEADLERYPLAGCVFAVDTATRGVPVRRFAG